MPMTLGDDAYPTVEAKLKAYVTNVDFRHLITKSKTRLLWNLDIYASYDFEHEGNTYSEPIRFYFDTMSFSEELRHWTDLTGQIIEWSNPNDVAGVDGSGPAFYLQAHQDVERGTIRFLEREGCKFRMTWDGTTGGYGDFSIDTWLLFQGVEIFHSVTEGAKTLDILARHLEPDDFVQESYATPHQVWDSFKPKAS